MDVMSVGQTDAETFMVAAGLVFAIIAAFCSSPQTAHLNAHARSDTLMLWVTLGLLVSFVFVFIAATVLKGGAPAIWGGALAGASLGIAYFFANRWGLQSSEPGTETYG